MGYQPRIKSHGAPRRGYRKPLHEKGKKRGEKHRRVGSPAEEQENELTFEQVSEGTLKRLHILGSQKFGSSPFGEHFNRWLMNVTAVLSEFESTPDVDVDDHFVSARTQILSNIEAKLEERRHEETALDEALKNQADSRRFLALTKEEFVAKVKEIRTRRNSEVKRLYAKINRLKEDLGEIVRMKAGFFRSVSKKEREKLEIDTLSELNAAQKELELAMLDFTSKQEELRGEYEGKRQLIAQRIKEAQKKIDYLEVDRSLEDRWFACEALADVVNAFLERKSLQH